MWQRSGDVKWRDDSRTLDGAFAVVDEHLEDPAVADAAVAAVLRHAG
jgi:hypothetical protein